MLTDCIFDKAAGVHFNPDTHEYFDEAGAWVPGVTEILRKVGVLVPPPVRGMDYYFERGRKGHLALELFDLDNLDELTLDDQLKGYVNAWRKFKEETGFVVENIERIVFNKRLRYAGTLDRIGVLNGRRTVLDIKTGAVQKGVALQVEGYREALNVEDWYRYDRHGIHVRQDGTYRLTKFDDPSDATALGYAVYLYKWGMK